MTKKIIPVFAIIIVIILQACKVSVLDGAKKSAEKFFETFNNQDIGEMYTVYMGNYADEAEKLLDSLGEITDYQLYKNKITPDDGLGATAELYYACKMKNLQDTMYFYFNVYQEGKLFFIGSLEFNPDKDFISNFQENYDKAQAVCKEYYNFIYNDDLESIKTLLDEKTISSEMSEYFLIFVKNRQEYYGKPKNFTLLSHKTSTRDNEPIFIITYKCETDGTTSVMFEEITLIRRNGEYKIIDDKYADTQHELETVE